MNNQGCASFVGRQYDGKQDLTLQDPMCSQVKSRLIKRHTFLRIAMTSSYYGITFIRGGPCSWEAQIFLARGARYSVDSAIKMILIHI